MDLINNLLEHCNNDNIDIINNLSDFIIYNRFIKEKELEDYQNNLFSDKDIIKNCKVIINNTNLDELDYNELNKVMRLTEKLNNCNDYKECCKLIIMINTICNNDIMIVYDCYKLILNGEL